MTWRLEIDFTHSPLCTLPITSAHVTTGQDRGSLGRVDGVNIAECHSLFVPLSSAGPIPSPGSGMGLSPAGWVCRSSCDGDGVRVARRGQQSAVSTLHNPWSLPSARPSPTSSHILVTNANGRLPTARPELLLAAAISPQLLTECPKPGDEEFAESVFARALGCRLQAASTTWNLIAFLIKELMRVVWKSYDLYLQCPVADTREMGTM